MLTTCAHIKYVLTTCAHMKYVLSTCARMIHVLTTCELQEYDLFVNTANYLLDLGNYKQMRAASKSFNSLDR